MQFELSFRNGSARITYSKFFQTFNPKRGWGFARRWANSYAAKHEIETWELKLAKSL